MNPLECFAVPPLVLCQGLATEVHSGSGLSGHLEVLGIVLQRDLVQGFLEAMETSGVEVEIAMEAFVQV